jgi:hypothetical protein
MVIEQTKKKEKNEIHTIQMKALWIVGTRRLNIYRDKKKSMCAHTHMRARARAHTHTHIPQIIEWMHSDRRHVGEPRKRWNRPTAIKMEQSWNSLYTLLLLLMMTNITLLQHYYVPPVFSNQNSAHSPY